METRVEHRTSAAQMIVRAFFFAVCSTAIWDTVFYPRQCSAQMFYRQAGGSESNDFHFHLCKLAISDRNDWRFQERTRHSYRRDFEAQGIHYHFDVPAALATCRGGTAFPATSHSSMFVVQILAMYIRIDEVYRRQTNPSSYWLRLRLYSNLSHYLGIIIRQGSRSNPHSGEFLNLELEPERAFSLRVRSTPTKVGDFSSEHIPYDFNHTQNLMHRSTSTTHREN
ncbi:hypothetical protein C8R45DRAFT_1084674 [Mycena sanguinolenta]|nr:hypothetical protein C8R45DRAFT_1084674 [Mycena sanguinolenta]